MQRPNAWTAERINDMLLLIINHHITGTPDYDWVASQMGVSRDVIRVKFNLLRREGSGSNIGTKVSAPSSPSKSPKKRKSGVKSEENMAANASNEWVQHEVRKEKKGKDCAAEVGCHQRGGGGK